MRRNYNLVNGWVANFPLKPDSKYHVVDVDRRYVFCDCGKEWALKSRLHKMLGKPDFWRYNRLCFRVKECRIKIFLDRYPKLIDPTDF